MLHPPSTLTLPFLGGRDPPPRSLFSQGTRGRSKKHHPTKTSRFPLSLYKGGPSQFCWGPGQIIGTGAGSLIHFKSLLRSSFFCPSKVFLGGLEDLIGPPLRSSSSSLSIPIGLLLPPSPLSPSLFPEFQVAFRSGEKASGIKIRRP